MTAVVLFAWGASTSEAAESVWDALRAPGTVVVLRHSYAPGGFDPRNLNENGRAQARRIAEAFRQHGIEHEANATTVTDACTGLWARALRNPYTDEYRASRAPVLPAILQSRVAQDVFDESRRREDGDYFPMLSGQAVGPIHDLPGAGEVVEAIVREALAVLAALAPGTDGMSRRRRAMDRL